MIKKIILLLSMLAPFISYFFYIKLTKIKNKKYPLKLLSLISISLGILGANLFGVLFKKYTLGLIGNTIAGVFGSAFLIKSFGRLGFTPQVILHNQSFNGWLFTLNVLVSLTGGVLMVLIIKKISLFSNLNKKT